MVEQAEQLTLTSRAFRNDQLGAVLRGARRAHRLAQGAADELRRRGGGDRDQGRPQVGLRGQGRAGGPGRDHRRRRQLPRPHHGRSSASRPTRRRAAASARSRRASSSCRSATPTRCEAAITPNTVAFLVEPIQGEAGVIIPPAGYLHAGARALHAAQRHADPRRDPDRPRPHRQAARRGARGHRGRRDADRQGAVGRLLPGLGRALELRGAGRAAARPARLDLRRQPAGLRGRARGAEGAGRGRHDRELGRDGRLLHGRPRGRSAPTASRRCAAAA